METYIKLYDWIITKAGLPYPDFLVYALVLQITSGGIGYWGGYRTMAERLNIPKAACKQSVKRLVAINAVTETREDVLHKKRIVLRNNPDFSRKFSGI